MKTEKNILIAFLLNLTFSAFELVGGILTGSIAILSDALHDIGDATSIGLSYLLERKSKKQPDETHTYGYLRYSVLGGLINTVILSVASVFVIFNAVKRIVNPVEINYDGMIIFALMGTAVNLAAVFFTSGGKSVNQKAVNLHMLEDVFGWVVVLIGGAVMKFTDIAIIDPVMSVGVSAFIFINALKNLKVILDLFLEKTPEGIYVKDIKEHLMTIEGVKDVHHIHIRSIDAVNNYAELHAVTDEPGHIVKNKIKDELREHGINHVTVELESTEEHCCEEYCFTEQISHEGHHHHHHHHH